MSAGFVPPHLSLEFLAKAGMFHPHLPNLAGKYFRSLSELFLIIQVKTQCVSVCVIHVYAKSFQTMWQMIVVKPILRARNPKL